MKFQLFLFLLIITKVYGQGSLKIQPGGEKLRAAYLSMNVESLWIAGTHINWETGEPDMPGSRHSIKTHCSAFVAAACERMGVYILRPPQHGQVLLANAQSYWLNSGDARTEGWIKLENNQTRYKKAQELANAGKIVVAVYKNDDPSKPGHAALVMPADDSEEAIKDEGPEMIMAGTHNFNKIQLIKAFKSHITAWPLTAIEFFVHKVPER